ncbi:sigma-54-dependent Fis family transcriptional regulator [uncultured Mailhella sp.]|uniref:sigma-54 interaction domain-containing protein n=1 Tax=uncultured Mailhella sp. TaxID=1981031 RepID=UPI0025EFCA3B|nr:sigma-54 dependent transcriptional regulator [uncultured Mailhella sp.]
MSVHKAEFFEQATEHLLSNLDLQEGLGQLLSYLSTVLPCREIRLATYFMQEQGSAKNLHLRASLSGTSLYYGPLLNKGRLDEMISLKNRGGELIDNPHHPLVIFCRACSTSGHPPMPLPWYDIVLWDKSKLIGECRFSGPFSHDELELLDTLRPVLCIAVSNYQKCQELENNLKDAQKENQRLKRSLHTSQAREILQDQLGLQQVVERTGLVAMHDIPVLITGETGSGKELIARMIHELSPRRSGPFIAINCGAIPSALIDSELFGHRKGSFTGAVRDHKGYFERADGGTLFLDEVGELPMDMQARLLRVLQEQEIVPVGASRPIRIDTRIVAATNQDLPVMIDKGVFRADLYFRLNGAHIALPPLRERLGDLPVIVHHLLEKLCRDFRIPSMHLATGELEKLYSYSWPGNIRELQNVLMEAMAISPDHDHMRLSCDFAAGQSVPRHGELPGKAVGRTPRSLRSSDVMAEHYRNVMESCGWKIKGPNGAAAILGLHPSTLRFRLKKLGLLNR